MTEQLAMFEDLRPKERARRTAATEDPALTSAIVERPHLERQLRVIRQLFLALCPIISTGRVVEHADGDTSEALEALEFAIGLGWVYPHGKGQYIPAVKRGKR